jgi:Tfp pilus assembly PilM family ATPase
MGIEITARAIRTGVLLRRGGTLSVLAAKTEWLSPGMVNESYSVQNIQRPDEMASLLKTTLRSASAPSVRRVGLSLPDGIFRVQNLEFDELPQNTIDRERLIRWRLEKGATFDVTGSVLRYQVHPRPGKGFFLLACVAKQDVLVQYDDLISRMGYEVWDIGLSSFHALNFYVPTIIARGAVSYAFLWVTENSYSTIIMERNGPRFYRFREIKAGSTEEAAGRIMREIEDALHFYVHRDRQQPSEIGCLYLAGDSPMVPVLGEEMKRRSTLEVEMLTPAAIVQQETSGDSAAMAPVYGAGGGL